MRIQLYLLAMIIFLISGCGDSLEKERAAVAIVAQKVNAGKAQITVIEYSDTDHRNRKSIVLTLDSFTNIPKGYNNEKITSIAALMYLKQFDKSFDKAYDDISINLEKKFEKKYAITDLRATEDLLTVIGKFIDATEEKDFKQVKEVVDENVIPDSILYGAVRFINNIDSVYGKINHIAFNGFTFDVVKETNEPVLVSWIQTNHTTTTTDFKFMVSRTSKKIVYFGINETD